MKFCDSFQRIKLTILMSLASFALFANCTLHLCVLNEHKMLTGCLQWVLLMAFCSFEHLTHATVMYVVDCT